MSLSKLKEGGVRPLFKKENEMSSQISSVISGVLVAVVTAICFGIFTMYTDLELQKSKTQGLEIAVKERLDSQERFSAMMHQMDKSIAVQMEAVNILKDTVKRLEDKEIKK